MIPEEIYTKPYDWEFKDNDNNCEIYCYSLNRNSESTLLRVEDFPMFFYFDLPKFSSSGLLRNWNISKINELMEEFKFRLKDKMPIRYKLTYNQYLYGFQNGKTTPMVKVFFKNIQDSYNFAKMLNRPFKSKNFGELKLQVHEKANLVGIITKLLTKKNLTNSTWIKCLGKRVEDEDKISTFKHEFIVNYNTFEMVDLSICSDWYTYPKIMAFDIEQYSDNHKAMPVKENHKHKCWVISCIFEKLGDTSTRKNYGIILGDSSDIDEDEEFLIKHQNTTIIRVKNFDEIDLINKKFTQLIIDEDPDVIIGYNIFRYDWATLAHRLSKCAESWINCGRMKNLETIFHEDKWESKAYGAMIISYLKIPGRISIDLLPVIKRDYKLDVYKLNAVSEYFLHKNKDDISPQEMFKTYEQSMEANNKCEQFIIKNFYDNEDYPGEDYGKSLSPDKNYYDLLKTLADEKQKLSEEFKYIKDFYKKTKERVGKTLRYCFIDSILCIELFKKINCWISSSELSNIVRVNIFELSTRGQQLRCISQLYNACQKESPKVIINVMAFEKGNFNGGFVQEPIPGVGDNILCFDFKSLYPSIMRAYNICYTTLINYDDNTVSPSDYYDVQFTQEEELGEKEDRGIRNNIEGMEECDDLDFINETDKYELYLDGEKKKKEKISKEYKLKFYNKKQGVLPKLVEHLVNERNKIRKIQKNIKDEVLYQIYESRQLALKVSANSFFGFLGAQKLPFREGASAITALGRILITKVNEYLKDDLRNDAKKFIEECDLKLFNPELYKTLMDFLDDNFESKVVYNDTDSSMIDIGLKDSRYCKYWGLMISQLLSGVDEGAPTPFEIPGILDKDGKPIYQKHKKSRNGIFHSRILELEFEKAMRMFRIKKKKYFAFLIDNEGEFEMIKNSEGVKTDQYKTMAKGIVLARRDNFVFLRKTYFDLIISIMTKKGFKECLNTLVSYMKIIYDNKVDLNDLLIVKSLGSSYKSPSAAMKVFADELKLDGKEATPGDRLQFLIVKANNEPLLGKRMKLIEQFIQSKDSKNPYKLDFDYYIENGFRNCINQIWAIAFKDEIQKMDKVIYTPYNKLEEQSIKLNDIVMVIHNAYKDKQPIDTVVEGIFHCYDHFIENKIPLDEKKLKLHQINNLKRVMFDEALKNKVKTKKIVKIKKNIKSVTQVKGQKIITSYIPVIQLKKKV